MPYSKDHGQPVSAYRRLLDREPIPFISREDIILELREYINKILDNQGGTAIIKGESGIGKTRLVEKFLEGLEPDDITIMKTRIFGSSTRPYEPFSSLFSHYFDIFNNKSRILTHLVPLDIAPVILSLLPNLKPLYPVEVSTVSYSDMDVCSAVNQLLENISRLKPAVIFLDDLQLISPRAKKVIQFVHERLDNKAIFIIGCFTEQETKKKEKQEHLFDSKKKERTIALDCFTLDETGLFINNIFDQDFSPSFNRWMFEITRGNPFFIKEFIKEIVSQNILEFSEAGQKWHIEKNYKSIKVPDSISTIFQARFDQLGEKELSFLQIAALINEQFEPDMVRSVLRISKSDAVKVQARLSREFFVPVMRTNYVQFTHPVEREILRKSLSVDKQRLFHRKIAKILEKRKVVDHGEIARHITDLLLDKEKTPQLCHVVFNASKCLVDSGDLASAHSYGTIALDIARSLGERFKIARYIIEARLIILTMSLKHNIPDRKRATKIADELLRFGMIKLGINLHIMIYRFLYAQTTFQRAADYIGRVIRNLPRKEPFESILFRLKIEQSMVWRHIGKTDNARRLIRRLLNKYSLQTNKNAYCYGLNIIGLIYYREGHLKTAVKYFQQLVDIAEELNNVPMKAVALVNLNAVTSKMGDIEGARDLTRQYHRLILKTGQEYKMAIYWGSLAYCSLYEGNFQDSLQYIDKALEKPINAYTEFSMYYIKAEICIYMEKLDQAYQLIEQNPVDLKEPPAQGEWLAYADTVRAQYFLKRGDLSKARISINKAVRIARMNDLDIEHGVALVIKGIIQRTNAKTNRGMSYVKKGIALLRERGASSYLAPHLCEAGLTFVDQSLYDQGIELLDKIKAHGWIRYFEKRAQKHGIKPKYERHLLVEHLRINTFGGLEVISPGRRSVRSSKHWKSAKARELLGLFITNTGSRGITWGEFALQLWPDFGTKTARNNFHFTLSTLRDNIGEKYIIHENNFYRLDKNIIQVDLWDFDELYMRFRQYRAQHKVHLADQCAKQAVKIIKSDFLPEFHNETVQARRADIRQKTEDLLMWLARRCIERHEYQEAMRLAYRLLEKDPVNEAAHRLIIRSYIELNERARAVRQYKRFKKILKQDFGLEPAAETKNLIEPLGSYNKD
jgi:two-component SAPR family response regulator